MKFSFLWTAILLLSLLDSCTVEKRLYQRGYHIEWNKRVRSVAETETLTEKQATDQVIQTTKQQLETIVALPAPEETAKTPVFAEPISQTQDRALNAAESETVTNNPNSDQQTKSLNETLERKSTLKKVSHWPGSRNSSPFLRGLVFILVGLLLIGISLLFVTSFEPIGFVLFAMFCLIGGITVIVGFFIMTFG